MEVKYTCFHAKPKFEKMISPGERRQPESKIYRKILDWRHYFGDIQGFNQTKSWMKQQW